MAQFGITPIQMLSMLDSPKPFSMLKVSMVHSKVGGIDVGKVAVGVVVLR